MGLYYQTFDENNNSSWRAYDPAMGALVTIPESSYQGEYGNETVPARVGYYGPEQSYWDEYGGGTSRAFNDIRNPIYSSWAEYQADPYGVGANRYNPYASGGSDPWVSALRQLTSQAQYEGALSADQMLYERWLEQQGPSALAYGIGGKYNSSFTIPYANEGFGREYIGVAERARNSPMAALYDLSKYYMSQPGFVAKYGRAYTPEELGLNWQNVWDWGQSQWDQYINSYDEGGFFQKYGALLPFIAPPLMALAAPALAGAFGGAAAAGIDAATAAGIMGGVEGAAVGGLSPLAAGATGAGGGLSGFLQGLGGVTDAGATISNITPIINRLATAGLSEFLKPDQASRAVGTRAASGTSPVASRASEQQAMAQPIEQAAPGGADVGSPTQTSPLAESVVSTASESQLAQPRRPKLIRLTPGFTRGAA